MIETIWRFGRRECGVALVGIALVDLHATPSISS